MEWERGSQAQAATARYGTEGQDLLDTVKDWEDGTVVLHHAVNAAAA
jgi:hypothetical protein